MSDKHFAKDTDEPASGDALGAAPAPDPTDELQLLRADGTMQESEEDMEARMAMEGLMRHRKARTRKKLIVGGIIGGVAVVAAIVAGVMVLGSGSKDDSSGAPMTTVVEKGNFSEAVTASGSAQPVESVVVSPGVDGTIESVSIAEGDTVSEGDVIMTLSNSDLDKKVTEAANAVRDAKLGVTDAYDAYNAKVDEYNKANEKYEKDWQTYYTLKAEYEAENPDKTYTGEEPTNNGPTDKDFQDADRAIDKANNSLADAQAAYDEAVETAGKRTVKAPKSGSVVVMNAQVGASITSGGTGSGNSSSSESGSGALIQIADLSQMMVKVNVNEVDISKISVGQAATVTFSALPDVTADATVTRIATVSSASGSSSGSGGSGVATYEVCLLIPNPAEGLKPGMTANVSIQIQSMPDTLIVPASSVGTDADGTNYVMVVTDAEKGTYERRTVTVTASDKSNAAVQGLLDEGATILLNPTDAETGAAAGSAAGSDTASGSAAASGSDAGASAGGDSDGLGYPSASDGDTAVSGS
ncbi:MAG: efflux RND transporter periplasmic adaptor subunit [Coriobacteriia bacterium]|nr:efflux RND transporter periplasmic adaptor subunit [Coriobacteriia bacterium]